MFSWRVGLRSPSFCLSSSALSRYWRGIGVGLWLSRKYDQWRFTEQLDQKITERVELKENLLTHLPESVECNASDDDEDELTRDLLGCQLMLHQKSDCGNSSVGRARPCQGRGREFESRFPLQNNVIRHECVVITNWRVNKAVM